MIVLGALDFEKITRGLLAQEPIMTGEWQSQDISDKPMLATRELTNVSVECPVPLGIDQWMTQTECNLPWAEDHFSERVCGQPLNPPPSEAWWPFAQEGNKAAKSAGVDKFSHTYPERMWPRFANEGETRANGRQVFVPHNGIRFEYGDLADVVDQLTRGPLTRQAYLPIWFPEDTGAVHEERVPCTLGYHFMIRGGVMQITYYIRSCDFMRHYRDDVYMAGRLLQWMCLEVSRQSGNIYTPGMLYMHIVSFHIFEGDVPMLQHQLKEMSAERSRRLMEALG